MGKVVSLNRVALWRPIRSESLSVRKYSGGYGYQLQDGTLGVSTSKQPVTRYAKNFKKAKQDFSLFVFSDEADEEKVDSYLDSLVKKIKGSEISEALTAASMSDFKYLDFYYEGDK